MCSPVPSELSPPSSLLVAGNRIERIGLDLVADSYDDVNIIEGAGRTLIPGLIDAHWHSMWATVPMQVLWRRMRAISTCLPRAAQKRR